MALSAFTMTARADMTPAANNLFTLFSMKSFLSCQRSTQSLVIHNAMILIFDTWTASETLSALHPLPLGVAQEHVALRTWQVEPAQEEYPFFHRSLCS